ncbi:CT214 family putative inclusion membrane protein [Chlamydia buteonis]|uniref:Inner membrane protein n=1 Tax=Chlamydia buteonis TaxID=2494525 RepID=A0ABX8L9H9_9CHLA|nr:hypothetical protein [Chlamydia buteonis]QXE27094.1 hypothetical protein HBN95_03005 [Chlamydia buteonis]QXE27975.1 hypothetical protein JJJ19_00140 [Chlamydia buteonis]
MSQPSINAHLRANTTTNQSIHDVSSELVSIVPSGKDTACKIRQSQIISLISAVIAAILLLAILILQLIPGAPVAFTLVLGLVLVGTTAISLISFAIYFLKIRKIFFELSEASKELRNTFFNFSLDFLHTVEPQRITQLPRYGLRSLQPASLLVSNQVSTTSSSNSIIATSPASTSTPSLSLPSPLSSPTQTEDLVGTEVVTEDLSEEGTSASTVGEEPAVSPERVSTLVHGEQPSTSGATSPDMESMNVDALFQSNLMRLLDIAQAGGRHPSIEEHPRYKKEHSKATKSFSVFCRGIRDIWNKLIRGETPVSVRDLLTMSTIPLFSADNHSILSITCNAKAAFSSDLWGAFWLNDTLINSQNAATLFDLIRLLKTLNQQSAYTASLISLNVLLSGWCLCNQNLSTNVVGSVEKLPLSQQDKMLVLEMLNSGNIIGALVFIHGRNDPSIKAIMRIHDINARGKTIPNLQAAVDIPFESIDPYNLRAITVMGDLAESNQSGQDSTLMREFQRIFERLGDHLPSGISGLAYSFGAGPDPQLSSAYAEATDFLRQHPPTSTSKIFCVLQASRGAPKLQTRLKAYLPYAGKAAIASVISTLILGGYSLGLFTHKQINGLRSALGISERDLLRLIESRKIAGAILPQLLL